MPKPIFEYSTGLEQLGRDVWERLFGGAEERLRPFVVDVPKRLKRIVCNFWFPGECFPRAIYFVRQNPKLPTAEYILGESVIGGLGQHGWVEYEDLVFDPVLQEWYQRDGYYASEFAKPRYRFSRPATMYLNRQMERLPEYTYCWDQWLRLPLGKNTPISLEQAKAYLGEAKRKRRGSRSEPETHGE